MAEQEPEVASFRTIEVIPPKSWQGIPTIFEEENKNGQSK